MIQSNYMSFKDIIATKTFQDFVDAARNYCLFIETQESDNEKEFLQITQRLLLTLYTLGLGLPNIHINTEVDFDTDLSNTEMKAILKFIAARVPFSYYWVVLNPVDMENLADTGTGDLIDDMGDIYKDLKTTLLLFDKDDAISKENAVWQFKFDYDYHWGQHAIEALQAIFHYLYEKR